MPRYLRPTSRADALEVLAQEGSGARPLVGGTDLLVGLRHHTVEPTVIVDLKSIPDLPEPLTVTEEGVTIGPTAIMGELAVDPTIGSWYPALVEAALTVGSVAIRNRASFVGNMCNGSPAADTAPPLLAYGASITIASSSGERTIPLADFFHGPRKTACGPGEMVVSISVPRPVDGSGSACRRLTRRRGVDLATVSLAVVLDAQDRAVFGLGAVGPRPLVTAPTQPLPLEDEPALTAAVGQALQIATPITDVRAGKAYRVAMLGVLARRAVLAAAQRR